MSTMQDMQVMHQKPWWTINFINFFKMVLDIGKNNKKVNFVYRPIHFVVLIKNIDTFLDQRCFLLLVLTNFHWVEYKEKKNSFHCMWKIKYSYVYESRFGRHGQRLVIIVIVWGKFLWLNSFFDLLSWELFDIKSQWLYDIFHIKEYSKDSSYQVFFLFQYNIFNIYNIQVIFNRLFLWQWLENYIYSFCKMYHNTFCKGIQIHSVQSSVFPPLFCLEFVQTSVRKHNHMAQLQVYTA